MTTTSRRDRRRAVALAAMLVTISAFACQAILGIEDTGGKSNNNDDDRDDGSLSSSSTSSSSSSGGEAAADVVLIPNEAGDQPDLVDATIATDAIVGDGAPPPPPPPTACLPTTTFIPQNTGATGAVCNPSNVLPGHTAPAGLDYINTGAPLGMINGHTVTSCLGVTFTQILTQVTVRAGSLSKACNKACVDPNCDSGHSAHVFMAVGATYTYLGTVNTTSTYVDTTFTMPVGSAASQVFACRTGFGDSRDDVALYSIFGVCKP